MAWGGVLALLFGMWTYQAHQQLVETAVRDPEQRALLEGANRQLVWVLYGIGALSAAALGLVGFVMTHRVAGPIHVMGHFLSRLAEGRYPARRGLRKRDELRGFYEKLLEVVEVLKRRDAQNVEELEGVIVTLRGALPRCPELAGPIEVLGALVVRRREALAENPTPAAAVVLEGRA